LRQRGLVRLAGTEFTLHRVPAALLRDRCITNALGDSADGDRIDTAQTVWAHVAVRLLYSAMPDDPWNNPPVWPQWRPLIPHILSALDPDRPLDDVAREVTTLLRSTGDYLLARGEPRAARQLCEQAYAFNKDRLDPNDPTMIQVVADLSFVLSTLGDYGQARTLDEDTFSRRRRVLGEDHPDTRLSAENLAAALRKLGETPQS
jgi:tetratricopeptide repeat protein